MVGGRVMDNHHCCPKSYGCTSNAPTSHVAWLTVYVLVGALFLVGDGVMSKTTPRFQPRKFWTSL